MEMEGNVLNNLLSNESQNVSMISTPSPFLPKHPNEKTSFFNSTLTSEINYDQPLDLSTKQTTPSSTDTGFGNGSSFMDNVSSLQNTHQMTNQSTYAVSIMFFIKRQFKALTNTHKVTHNSSHFISPR